MKTLSLSSDDRRVLRAVFDAVPAGGKGADVMQLKKNLRIIEALSLDDLRPPAQGEQEEEGETVYSLEDADWELLLKLFREKRDWSTHVEVTKRVVAVWEKLGTPSKE
jgi:hypothetical protein